MQLPEPYNEVRRFVKLRKIHPKYESRFDHFFTEFDLALLKLDRPVKFAPNIIPICLPSVKDDFGGDSGYVTGWGNLEEDGDEDPSTLREVHVPLKAKGMQFNTLKNCHENLHKNCHESPICSPR